MRRSKFDFMRSFEPTALHQGRRFELLSSRGKWIIFLFFFFLFFFFLLCFLLERYAQTFFQGENIGEKKKEKKKNNPFTSA